MVIYPNFTFSFKQDRTKRKGEIKMKILNSIYKFLLGEDTDVPFEEPENRFEAPDPEPVSLRLVTDYDAA